MSDQGTTWRATAFNDGGWASGPAELGYGDGDEATVVRYGPDGVYVRARLPRRELRRFAPYLVAEAHAAPARSRA